MDHAHKNKSIFPTRLGSMHPTTARTITDGEKIVPGNEFICSRATATARPLAAVMGGHEYMPTDKMYQQSIAVGKVLALAGYSIRTGGYGGLMEAVSQGAAEAGYPAEGIGLAGWEHESRNRHVPESRYLEARSICERS